MPNIYDTEEVTLIETVPISTDAVVDNSSFSIYLESPIAGGAYIQISAKSSTNTTAEVRPSGTNTLMGTGVSYILPENYRTWIGENINDLSYLKVRDRSFGLNCVTRVLNPKHFEFSSLIQPISVILSNLSSLHAELANSYYSSGVTFEQVTSSARNDMNSFFNDSVSSGLDSFDIGSLIDVTGFSDSYPGQENYIESGQLVKNVNHYINTNYNFLDILQAEFLLIMLLRTPLLLH